jgi:acyl-coenzyme A thioesterase 13
MKAQNMSTTNTVPAGFGPIFRSSPLLDALGGFHSRGGGPTLEVGLLVGERHVNSRGTLHGGAAATLADSAIGYLLAFRNDPPSLLVTVSLTLDYVAAARIGDWIDVRLDGHDATGRLVFATASLVVGERVVARARAVFTLVS